jgi:hypothetical protein
MSDPPEPFLHASALVGVALASFLLGGLFGYSFHANVLPTATAAAPPDNTLAIHAIHDFTACRFAIDLGEEALLSLLPPSQNPCVTVPAGRAIFFRPDPNDSTPLSDPATISCVWVDDPPGDADPIQNPRTLYATTEDLY